MLGCIDGTSISIRTPAHKIKNTYVNRHDQPSLTLQGLCDSKRKFLDVFTGAPGKIHDSRVFRLSPLSNTLPQICGQQYHILGDSAYPLREYLLTPYRDYGNLTAPQINYNYKFSATRVRIENTFGILKGRFRQLNFVDFHTVDKITKFIISCCILHNLCTDLMDLWEMVDYVPDIPQPCNEEERNLRLAGEEKRGQICNQLYN